MNQSSGAQMKLGGRTGSLLNAWGLEYLECVVLYRFGTAVVASSCVHVRRSCWVNECDLYRLL